jgi:putative ABC transport system ATP-binding protein
MIKTEHIKHCYRGQETMEFEDWTIGPAEQWVLLGKSGSGKSTLIHILTGLLKPKEGKVLINNTDIYELSQRDRDRFRGQKIGLIFQRPHLIKSLTVRDNLRIAQGFAGFAPDKKQIDEVLETLGIQDKGANYPEQLSEGQLQRVSIARAAINKPALLVADEPTSSLDDKNAEIVLDLLISQSQRTRAILIISTHDKRIKDRFTNRYLIQ